jgi:FYVE zinc finger
MDRRPQDTTANAYNSISPSSIPPSRPSLLASSPLHSPHPTAYIHHPPPSSDSSAIPHGETWMDFIRNQPSQQHQQHHYHHHLQQQPSSRAESSPSGRLPSLPDRKRRFSSLNQSPESASYSSSSRHPAPGLNSSHINHRSRPNSYTPYTSHMATRPHASSLPGSSTAPSRVVIDLTGDNYNTDNTRSSNRVRSSTASANSPGGIILPPWQLDSDVTFCPVCASQFTFWYRKHHCRYVEPRTSCN